MRPKRAPKRHPKSPKVSKKSDPKMAAMIIHFWTTFGQMLGLILEPKVVPEGGQKRDQFWNPLLPHFRGPNEAILGIKREW